MNSLLDLNKLKSNLQKGTVGSATPMLTGDDTRLCKVLTLLANAEYVVDLDINQITYEDIELLEAAKDKDAGSLEKIYKIKDIINKIEPFANSQDYI